MQIRGGPALLDTKLTSDLKAICTWQPSSQIISLQGLSWTTELTEKVFINSITETDTDNIPSEEIFRLLGISLCLFFSSLSIIYA